MEADDYSILELLAIGGDEVYSIPTYQREYKWTKQERNVFFDDILENDTGYFLGSVIGISVKEGPLKQHWELVDGQQRMISLSLILAAIYSKLDEFYKEHLLDKKQEIKFYNIKSQLILDGDENKIRVIPSIQNHNREDYKAILARALSDNDDKSNAPGNRRILQAYSHFQDRIEKHLEKSDNKIESIFDFLDKVNKSIVVMIDGGTLHGAYKLFRSLNDKGLELTPVDIIKSLFYASLFEKTSLNNSIPDFESDWDKLIESLGEEDAVQERFFRQYYNAFKKITLNGTALTDISGHRTATRSNLTEIFENVIRSNPEKSFKNIIAASRDYSFIIGRSENADYPNLTNLDPCIGCSYLPGDIFSRSC